MEYDEKISCAEACYASKMKRFFGGYLIDSWLVLSVPVAYLFQYLNKSIAFFSTSYPIPDALAAAYAQYGVKFTYGLVVQECVSLALIFLYFFLTEWLAGGKSLGKYVCKTVVVDRNGNKPSVGRLALRSLCRLIPFDNLSYLFFFWSGRKLWGAWHDQISGTYVVDEALLEEWKAGNYDGSDKFGAMVGHMMRERGMEVNPGTPDDQDQNEEGERKLRVEDLYPSDDPDEQ